MRAGGAAMRLPLTKSKIMPPEKMPPMEAAPSTEEAGETIQVPASTIGGAQPGETVSFTVQSVDGDMATLAPAEAVEQEPQNQEPAPSAIKQAAGLFGESE